MEQDFIDRVYEASFTPEMWPKLLRDLGELTQSKGGLLLSTREKSLNWTASESVYDAFSDYLAGGWFRRCGRRVCLLEKAQSSFLTEQDYWTDEEIETNEIYREFFRPRDLGCSAGTGIIMPTGDHIVISVERSHKVGPIEKKQVEFLNALRPHLARAAMVAARMGLKSAANTKDAFAQLGVPTLLLNADGVVVEASDGVEAWADHLIMGANGRLVIKDAAANDLLEAGLKSIDDPDGVRSFPIRGDADEPAIVAHLLPIHGSAHDIFSKGYAILVLNPVDQKAQPSVDLLRSLFDLTASEANVARELAAGASVDEIAETGGVSVNTVRTQVRKVMEKTGCSRQPEVVALIANVTLQR